MQGRSACKFYQVALATLRAIDSDLWKCEFNSDILIFAGNTAPQVKIHTFIHSTIHTSYTTHSGVNLLAFKAKISFLLFLYDIDVYDLMLLINMKYGSYCIMNIEFTFIRTCCLTNYE
jgi:hypothetical protein